MKAICVAFLMGCTALPAAAGPCVALDYQEMKDMSAEELIAERCKAGAALVEAFDEGIQNIGRGPKSFPNAQENFDECTGQIARMDRVLASKGVTKDSVVATCQRRSEKQ